MASDEMKLPMFQGNEIEDPEQYWFLCEAVVSAKVNSQLHERQAKHILSLKYWIQYEWVWFEIIEEENWRVDEWPILKNKIGTDKYIQGMVNKDDIKMYDYKHKQCMNHFENNLYNHKQLIIWTNKYSLNKKTFYKKEHKYLLL